MPESTTSIPASPPTTGGGKETPRDSSLETANENVIPVPRKTIMGLSVRNFIIAAVAAVAILAIALGAGLGAGLAKHSHSSTPSSSSPTGSSSPSSTATPTSTPSATVVGSTGCGKALPSAQAPAGGDSHQVTIDSEGTTRHYRIHIPSNYNESNPIPLIFSFHARGKTSSYQEGISNFSNETVNPNAIVVYPQGLKDEWQGDPSVSETSDLSFVKHLMDHLKYRYCINENTVYANGMSNGGGLTSLIACNATLSSYFAAVAPISGAFYYPNTTTEKECNPYTLGFTCNPSRVMPVLEMHGMQDTTINYTGGWHRDGCLPDIPHYISAWGERNGVGIANYSAEMEDDTVEKYQWGNDTNLGIVTHYALKDLGHVWPTADNSANIDGTQVIMDFFNRWSL